MGSGSTMAMAEPTFGMKLSRKESRPQTAASGVPEMLPAVQNVLVAQGHDNPGGEGADGGRDEAIPALSDGRVQGKPSRGGWCECGAQCDLCVLEVPVFSQVKDKDSS